MNELIEKYFENALTSEEQILFDERLNQDAEFKAEFDFYSELKNAITVSERQKIKAQIQTFENHEKDTIKVFNLRKLLPYAAVLVIAFSLVMYLVLNQNNTNDLYASNFEPYPNIEVSNLRSSTEKSLENDAFTAYDLEDYKLAQELFSKLSATEPKDYIYFYDGMCLMQLENFDLALEQLNSIKETHSKYYEKAIWFKALTYMKLNEKDKTKELLNELIAHYTFKNSEARHLLSKL
ncbi:tetratricopeptide repeat protein [Flavobacterium sp. U410]|jgi:tetratricopeptide (TPR) repeat protein